MSPSTVSRTGLAAACATALTLNLTQHAGAAVVDLPVKQIADGATAAISALGSYGVDPSNPATPTKVSEVSGGGNTTINSVAVRRDGLAVATVEPKNKTDNGELISFDASADELGAVLGRVGVGALPDIVTITPDGAYALVANEGEPAEDYSYNPEGSVSVLKLPTDVAAATQDDALQAGLSKVGDLGAEGSAFVSATDSPNGHSLLIVGNEVSGTPTVFQVDSLVAETTPSTPKPKKSKNAAPEWMQPPSYEDAALKAIAKISVRVTGISTVVVALVVLADAVPGLQHV